MSAEPSRPGNPKDSDARSGTPIREHSGPGLNEPVPPAPQDMRYLVRTRWQITLDDYAHAHTGQEWHRCLDEAVRSGMLAACVNACQWVTVHDADGTLECTWRHADEHGEYDNQWRNVGPAASARHAAHLADINTRIRANVTAGKPTQAPVT